MLRKIVVFGVITALSAACSPPAPDEASYLDRLVVDRETKDEMFSGANSIVPLDRRLWMVPLRYYEPDLAYRIPAQLNIADDQIEFSVPTSTGQTRAYRRVGTLDFTIKGEQMSLAALVEVGQTSGFLFIPFRDGTSGFETYPGGRYLDLPSTPTGIYDLDFNRAYHPNCYFNEDYDCPFPPPENRLAVKILAGERLPPEDEQRIPLRNDGQPSSETTPATPVP